jgi:hypothetical protein
LGDSVAFAKLGGDLSTRKLAQGDTYLEREQAAFRGVILVALRAPESHQAARADPKPATRPLRPKGLRSPWQGPLAAPIGVIDSQARSR